MSAYEFYINEFGKKLRPMLMEMYMDPKRHYHNLYHINDMLNICNYSSIGTHNTIGLMIWYHDAIYDATRTDNEERSAELAESHLKDKINSDELRTIVNGILLTKHQFSSPFVERTYSVLLDADLAILSHEWLYKAYSRNIRLEYSHVNDVDYAKGRSDFLKKMIARPEIYSSLVGVKRDSIARKNMNEELESLKVYLQ